MSTASFSGDQPTFVTCPLGRAMRIASSSGWLAPVASQTTSAPSGRSARTTSSRLSAWRFTVWVAPSCTRRLEPGTVGRQARDNQRIGA